MSGRVLRGGPPRVRVVPAALVDAREEAARRLDAAADEASTLVRRARDEADEIRAAARREGLAAAHAEAAALLVAAARARDAALADAGTDARTLALAAAARLAGEAFALAPGRIDAVVGEALGRMRSARAVEVRLHPDDATAWSAPAGVRVVGDASIARGGCVVTTERGRVDARLEVRLEALAAALDCAPPSEAP